MLVHGDLDAGLVLVVTASDRVPHRDYGLDVRQQVFARQEVFQYLADHRGAAKAAADEDLVADVTRIVLHDAHGEVMGFQYSAVLFAARNGDLELAAQELEFRVVGRPLADQFGNRARIFDLVRGSAREMVGGDVADGVARGLDRMHVDLGQRIQHIRDVVQLRPVILDVLTSGEMAVTLVPSLCQKGELVHLAAIQGAIGDGNAQHIGVKLQIDAIHQAQGFELVLGQRAGDAALDLLAELGIAGGQEPAVEIVVSVHG